MYVSFPFGILGVQLSHLVFVLPTAPIAILLYFWQKIFGKRYMLTNRNVQILNALGNRKLTQVPLNDIADVQIRQLPGQSFYKAADILLLTSKTGEEPFVLAGVPRADVFRQTIIKARDARIQTTKSLDTIKSRPALVG